MWAIAGLGNPGRKYQKTRHNIGFIVLRRLAEKYDIELSEEKRQYISGRGSIEAEEVVLVEPQTFMNRSGEALKKILEKHNIGPHRLIVIHDDMDMETGRLKIKPNGSSGGHRGVASIMENLETRDFIRVKIGVGRDASVDPEEYVLRKFSANEIPLIKNAVNTATEAVSAIITEGISRAMNLFNKKSLIK